MEQGAEAVGSQADGAEEDRFEALRAKVRAAKAKREARGAPAEQAEPTPSTEDRLAEALNALQSSNNSAAAIKALERGDLEGYAKLTGQDPRKLYKTITDNVLQPGASTNEERWDAATKRMEELEKRLESYQEKERERLEGERLSAERKRIENMFLGRVSEESSPFMSALDPQEQLEYGNRAASELIEAIQEGVLDPFDSVDEFQAEALRMAEDQAKRKAGRWARLLGGSQGERTGGGKGRETKTLTNSAVSEVASGARTSIADDVLIANAARFVDQVNANQTRR